MSTNNSLFDSIGIISNSQGKYDKTIIGTITSIVDATKKKYRVEHEFCELYVYSNAENYEVGDTVYINVPNGNFSNQKFILGKVQNEDDMIITTDLENSLIVSNRIFNLHLVREEAYTFNGAKYKTDKEDLLKNYLDIYKNKYMIIYARFHSINQIKEEYGIEIKWSNDLKYTLSLADMNGSIFRPRGELQYKLIKIPNNEIPTITTYCLNDKDSQNLQISTFYLSFASQEDLSKLFYYLDIKQTNNNPLTLKANLYHDGTKVNPKKCQWYAETLNYNYNGEAGIGWMPITNGTETSINLNKAQVPQCFVSTQDTYTKNGDIYNLIRSFNFTNFPAFAVIDRLYTLELDNDSCSFEFNTQVILNAKEEEDLVILSNYTTNLGGKLTLKGKYNEITKLLTLVEGEIKYINIDKEYLPEIEEEITEEKPFIKYNSNNNLTVCETINQDDLRSFKVMTYYNDIDYLSEVITVNGSDQAFTLLETPTNDKIDEFELIDSEQDYQIFYYTDQDDNIILSSPDSFQLYSNLKAHFYRYGTGYGTALWQLQDNLSSGRLKIKGQTLFHYDYNGNIDDDIYNKEYTIELILPSNIDIIDIKWYLTNGIKNNNVKELYSDSTELKLGEKYAPHNSMFDSLWVDAKGKVHFTIKPVHNTRYFNNILRAQCSTDFLNQSSKMVTINKTVEIDFIKNGYQGTNNSEYCCVVKYVDAFGQIVNDEEALLSSSQNEKNNIYVKPFIYKNNQLYNSNNIKITWESHSYHINIDNSGKISWQDNNFDEFPNYYYVTAKIEVDDYVLYYHQPVYVHPVINKVSYLEVPKFIQYTSAGNSPQWHNKVLKYGEYQDNFFIAYDNIVSITLNDKIAPLANYNNSSGIGVVLVTIGDKIVIYCPIVTYLEYQNKTLEGWNGTTITVKDKENKDTEILTPQVGVGGVNENGYYSGIIMSNDDKTSGGLYGYKDGEQQFALDSEGNVILGASGQIQVTQQGSQIGGWNLTNNQLQGGKTILHSENGITTNSIQINSSRPHPNGTDTIVEGIIGATPSANDENVDVFGVQTNNRMVIKADYINIAGTTDILLQNGKGDSISLQGLIDELDSISARLQELEKPK